MLFRDDMTFFWVPWWKKTPDAFLDSTWSQTVKQLKLKQAVRQVQQEWCVALHTHFCETELLYGFVETAVELCYSSFLNLKRFHLMFSAVEVFQVKILQIKRGLLNSMNNIYSYNLDDLFYWIEECYWDIGTAL